MENESNRERINFLKSSILYPVLEKAGIYRPDESPNIGRISLFAFLLWAACFIAAMIEGSLFRDPNDLKVSMLTDLAIHITCFLCFPLALIWASLFQKELDRLSSWLFEGDVIGDRAVVSLEIKKINCLLENKIFDRFLIAVIFISTLVFVGYDLTGDARTWHGWVQIGSFHRPTFGFLFAMTVTATYGITIGTFAIRGILYMVMMHRLSTHEINVDMMHPDNCGGLSNLNFPQVTLGIFIMSVGVWIVGAIMNNTLLYGLPLVRPDHLFFIVSYAVLSPTAFFLPVLFFTPHSYRAMREFKAWSNVVSRKIIRRIEANANAYADGKVLEGTPDDAAVAFLEYLKSTNKMRLIPLDLVSLKRFLGIVVSPLLLLLVHSHWLPNGWGIVIKSVVR